VTTAARWVQRTAAATADRWAENSAQHSAGSTENYSDSSWADMSVGHSAVATAGLKEPYLVVSSVVSRAVRLAC
jgi:hypothetical protein